MTVNHMKKASSAWWSARTCWIKQGLDIPVTLDDWYEALVAFKDMGIKYPLSCQAMMLTMAQCFSSAYNITVPVGI